MNDHYLRYLEREHARLDAEIREEEKRLHPRGRPIMSRAGFARSVSSPVSPGAARSWAGGPMERPAGRRA